MRMWGHTITPGHAMQPEKGSYNEAIFEGLDFILVRHPHVVQGLCTTSMHVLLCALG